MPLTTFPHPSPSPSREREREREREAETDWHYRDKQGLSVKGCVNLAGQFPCVLLLPSIEQLQLQDESTSFDNNNNMLAVVSCWVVAVRLAIKVMDRNQLRAEEGARLSSTVAPACKVRGLVQGKLTT